MKEIACNVWILTTLWVASYIKYETFQNMRLHFVELAPQIENMKIKFVCKIMMPIENMRFTLWQIRKNIFRERRELYTLYT